MVCGMAHIYSVVWYVREIKFYRSVFMGVELKCGRYVVFIRVTEINIASYLL